MNNNESIRVSELDVLYFSDKETLSLSKTIRFIELIERLEERAFHNEKDKLLMNDGVECELLQPGSQGWKKGKVKIHIEFIPEIIVSSELDSLREAN